ncbi:YrhB domain-containing protein [Streptomyces sp. CA-251251]|uniref:YrhB domain-containing protein n=1 Tax=Streptomyces sp. CA-251251 TaxID=3240063 RepID=UPI003D94D37C
MIEREAAVRAVEGQLERDYQRWRATGAEALRMAVADVEEHELVWIVSWTSEKFVRTRDPEFMLAGNGPYLVDRVDGGLHQVGVVSAVTGVWEDDYRARIRGLPVRTAVDEPARCAPRDRTSARTLARSADTAPEAADVHACGGHRIRERPAGR